MTKKNQNPTEGNARPTHTLRKNNGGYGKHANFETIGVAWEREEGGLYVKPYGMQIIDGGFYVFPNIDQTQAESGK